MVAPGFSLNIPHPPSVNTMFRNVSGVGRVKTATYKKWLLAAGNELLTQRRAHVGGTVAVTLTVKRRNKRADVDNLIKPVLDLLVTYGLIDDDRNVHRVTAQWGDVDDARVEVVAI